MFSSQLMLSEEECKLFPKLEGKEGVGMEIVLVVTGSSEAGMSPKLLTSNPALPPGQGNSLIVATSEFGINNL